MQEASGQGQGTGEQREAWGQGQRTEEARDRRGEGQEGGAAHAHLTRQEVGGRAQAQVAGGEVQDAGGTVRFRGEGLQGMEQRDSTVPQVDQDAPAYAAQQERLQQQLGHEPLHHREA